MPRTRLWQAALVCALVLLSSSINAQRGQLRINVVTNTPVTQAILADLATFGTVHGVIPELNAVMLNARSSDLPAIQRLPYVEAANPDAERKGSPVDPVAATDFVSGINTWNLDAVNVTNLQPGARSRRPPTTGRGCTSPFWIPGCWTHGDSTSRRSESPSISPARSRARSISRTPNRPISGSTTRIPTART